MKGLIVRWITNFVGLLVAAWLISGISYDSTTALAVAALVLTVVNVTIKPILGLLSLPVQIITLGLFTLVINGLMLSVVSALVSGFAVTGFMAAVFGSVVVSIVGGVLHHAIDEADRG